MTTTERLIAILDRELTVDDVVALPERDLTKLEDLLHHWSSIADAVWLDRRAQSREEESE